MDRDDDMDRDVGMESAGTTDMDCGVDFGGAGIAFFVCIVALTTTVAFCSYFLVDFCRDLIFCGHRYFFPTIDDFVTAVNSHVVLVGVDGGCVFYDIASLVDDDEDDDDDYKNDATMQALMDWVDSFYDDVDIQGDVDVPPMIIEEAPTCVLPTDTITTISKKRVTFSEQLVSSTFIVRRNLWDKIARGLPVALFPCKKSFPSRSFVATGRVLPTISEDCVTVSAQVVSSTRIVQRDLSDEIARGLEIASCQCEKDEDDAYDAYDDHDDDDDDDDGGGGSGNDNSVKDVEPEPAVPNVNAFCHSFPESLDCDEPARDDDDDDDDGIHDDKDEQKHKKDKDDTIYEVVKKKRSRTKDGVVLPVRRSTRLAERRLRHKLQDQDYNDTDTSTGLVLQADVLGSTVLNGRRRSARLLTNKTHSGH